MAINLNRDYSAGKKFEKVDANLSEKRFTKSIELKKDIYLPKKGFTTYKELIKFYDGLIKNCLYCELRRESIEASMEKLKLWTQKTVPLLKEFGKPAQMQLREINNLLDFERGRLDAIKKMIKTIYNTNELIINVFMEANGADKSQYLELEKQHQSTHPDLLHGGGEGWMFEYEVYLNRRKKGYLAFMTFGTAFDPAGVDIICFRVPMNRKIKLFTSFKRPKHV